MDWREAYRTVYGAFAKRFTSNAQVIAHRVDPTRQIQIEVDDLLLPWYQGRSSSYGDPVFEATLDMTPLPTREHIADYGADD